MINGLHIVFAYLCFYYKWIDFIGIEMNRIEYKLYLVEIFLWDVDFGLRARAFPNPFSSVVYLLKVMDGEMSRKSTRSIGGRK